MPRRPYLPGNFHLVSPGVFLLGVHSLWHCSLLPSKRVWRQKDTSGLKWFIDVLLQPLFKQPIWLRWPKQTVNKSERLSVWQQQKIPSQITARALSSISALHGSVLIVQLEIRILQTCVFIRTAALYHIWALFIKELTIWASQQKHRKSRKLKHRASHLPNGAGKPVAGPRTEQKLPYVSPKMTTNICAELLPQKLYGQQLSHIISKIV